MSNEAHWRRCCEADKSTSLHEINCVNFRLCSMESACHLRFLWRQFRSVVGLRIPRQTIPFGPWRLSDPFIMPELVHVPIIFECVFSCWIFIIIIITIITIVIIVISGSSGSSMTWSPCFLVWRLLLLATAVNGNSLVGPGAVGSFQGGGGGRRFGGSRDRH